MQLLDSGFVFLFYKDRYSWLTASFLSPKFGVKKFFFGFAPRGKTKIWLGFGPGDMTWMPKLHEFYGIQQFRIQQCEACDLTTGGS